MVLNGIFMAVDRSAVVFYTYMLGSIHLGHGLSKLKLGVFSFDNSLFVAKVRLVFRSPPRGIHGTCCDNGFKRVH